MNGCQWLTIPIFIKNSGNIHFMASYRTSMQIVGDLLTATAQSGQEGIKTTSLITKANLPHSRLSKFMIKFDWFWSYQQN